MAFFWKERTENSLRGERERERRGRFEATEEGVFQELFDRDFRQLQVIFGEEDG